MERIENRMVVDSEWEWLEEIEEENYDESDVIDFYYDDFWEGEE